MNKNDLGNLLIPVVDLEWDPQEVQAMFDGDKRLICCWLDELQ